MASEELISLDNLGPGKARMPGPREAEALRALARARAEDAKDAALPPCKICGGVATRHRYLGGESTGGGFVRVHCSGCLQEHRHGMDQIKPPYRTWDEAEALVMQMWITLNRP